LGTCAFTDTSGKKLCIAVARDAAFSFYYPTSLAVLERLGATLVPFSPLEDAALPEDVSGALFGGGFPEMFAEKLAANASMRASIRAAAENEMPIYAECGGYMYLMEELVDFDGKHHAMCGVFQGSTSMTKRLQMVGYVTARLNEDTILGSAGTELRGHEFHFSQEENETEAARPFTFTKLRNGMAYGAGQVYKNALGSYLHLHFAGCPGVAKEFVKVCARTRVKL
jgi:cobyrinic acid a,c-diamide synthase